MGNRLNCCLHQEREKSIAKKKTCFAAWHRESGHVRRRKGTDSCNLLVLFPLDLAGSLLRQDLSLAGSIHHVMQSFWAKELGNQLFLWLYRYRLDGNFSLFFIILFHIGPYEIQESNRETRRGPEIHGS